MKNKKVEWDLNCSYKHPGVDSELDKELNDIVGHRAHSSGFMIGEDERDLSWSFPNKRAAMKALIAVRNTGKIKNAEIFKYEE